MTILSLFGASAQEQKQWDEERQRLTRRVGELESTKTELEGTVAQAAAARDELTERVATLARQLGDAQRSLAGTEEAQAARDARIAELEEQAAAAEKLLTRAQRFKENQGKQLTKLGERLALSESIVHGVPEPLLVVDLEGHITYANALCLQAAGLPEDSVLKDMREEEVWRFEPGVSPILAECLETRAPIIGVERAMTGAAGVRHLMVCSAAPRLTSTGECKGAFAIYRDVTERALLLEQLVDAGDRVAEVHATASQILASSREQVTTAAEQASTVSQVSSTTAELSGSAAEVADACTSIAASTAELLHTAIEGREILDKSVDRLASLQEMTSHASQQLSDLGERTRRIEGIVDLIGKVAAETKLIAFNAAIEAARAGDAGRGFSVVASEVKSLAENVASSSTEIKAMVGDIRASTSQSILTAEGQLKLMEEVGASAGRSSAAFREIVTAIEGVATRASEISSASQQQKSAVDMLTLSMGELANTANLSATSARDAIGSVSALTEFAHHLNRALEHFKGDAGGQ